MIELRATQVVGLPETEGILLQKCLDEYNRHLSKNLEKERFYEGNIRLADVNLGLALPKLMQNLEIGCAWGAKAVDVLAARSMFDGFVGSNGAEAESIAKIVTDNRLITEYGKACRDELKYGCSFAALSADDQAGSKIRFYSPKSAGAIWNGEKGRIDCGFVVVAYDDTDPVEPSRPLLINFYTDKGIWVLRNQTSMWTATGIPHRIGRPLMEPLIWNATSNKPFGRSRIKMPIRNLIKGYVRTVANATIGLEFATSPQKYLLGVTDEQYDIIINDKFKQYVGSIIAATTNPETGEKPTFGQLSQGTIAPHVEMLRVLATQFSAATGLPVTDTGVINDANPTSSDAIEAQSKTLVGLAQDLNTNNADALRVIVLMALAVANGTTIEALEEEQRQIVAHFRNPAMPSVAATTDAAIKLASAREGFASTDVFLEMVGFSPADIRRIKAQETRSRGLAVLEELRSNDNQQGNLGRIRQNTESGTGQSNRGDEGTASGESGYAFS